MTFQQAMWVTGLLILGSVDPASAAEGSHVPRVLTWSVNGASQRLAVTTDGLLTGKPDHGTYLESVVGPMVSTRFVQQWEAENGGYNTEYLQVEYRGEYRFSLADYLERSRQGGRVLAALLKGATLPPPPRCPPLSEVSGWPSFTEGREQLLKAGCGEPSRLRLEPEAFSILDWDGTGEVHVAIQVFHPEAARSAFGLERVGVWLKAPAEWQPWLAAAQRGEGLFEARKQEWLSQLSPGELASMREQARKLKPAAGRKFIETRVYQTLRAPLSAAELVDALFPEREGLSPDVDTQWAWSDRLLYLRDFPDRCLEAADVLFRHAWSPAPARAAAFNVTRCGGWQGEEEWKRCRDDLSPVSCLRPWYKAQLELQRSARKAASGLKLQGPLR